MRLPEVMAEAERAESESRWGDAAQLWALASSLLARRAMYCCIASTGLVLVAIVLALLALLA